MNADKDTAPGLVILWISRDPDAARNMALMYAKNSRLKGWWDAVHLLLWGPSAQLLAEDPALQEEVAACMAAGVTVLACRACAERHGVAEALRALGVTVQYAGEPLTAYLKGGWKVLSV